MAKVRTQVYLEKEQEIELKLLANSTRKTFSELIREGIDILIKKNKPKKKKKFGEGFIGAIKGGAKTNAVVDIHDYYENLVK